MSSKEHLPGEQDFMRLLLAHSLDERFLQRRDSHARQLEDGRYAAIKRPVHRKHLLAHLRGEITLGAYVLDEDSQARFLVVDADDEPDWRRLNELARVLGDMGCAVHPGTQSPRRPFVAFLRGPLCLGRKPAASAGDCWRTSALRILNCFPNRTN